MTAKNRKLKKDNEFIPCPEDNGDEFYPNGIFVFNITKMTEYILNHQDIFIAEEVTIKEFHKFLSINESHIDSVDISKPVILAEIAPGRYNLIDGQHRVEKAHRLGIEKIKAYRITPDHHIRFLNSKFAYEKYVEYWNDKL